MKVFVIICLAILFFGINAMEDDWAYYYVLKPPLLYKWIYKKMYSIGRKINNLEVVKFLGRMKFREWYLVKCFCGRKFKVVKYNLKNTKSCGCSRVIHGQSGTNEYKIKHRYSLKGMATSLYNMARKRAIKRNLGFNITTELIYEKLKLGHCIVTKIPFDYTPKTYNPFCPSIDRIDSNKGYTPENIQLVVLIYNQAKNKYTHEDVLKLAQALNSTIPDLNNKTPLFS